MTALHTDDHVGAIIWRWRSRLALTVRSPHPSAPERCEHLLTTMADDVERLASRFRDDSELAAVNRSAGRWTDVSWSFVAVLTAAITAAERTGGLVDPCLGHLVDAAGYRFWRDGVAGPRSASSRRGPDGMTEPRSESSRRGPDGTRPDRGPQRDPGRGPHRNPGRGPGLDRTRRHHAYRKARDGWQGIEVRPALRGARVRIPPGCQLDLGAIGKAWLADRLVERVVDGWGDDAIADMGGDVRAVGVSRPWTLAADPQLAGWRASVMSVSDAGLATSGVGRRRWRTTEGVLAHHIIDPRTGRPAATPWWTASVLAADAKDANAAATAAVVLGDAAPEWLDAAALDAWLVPAPDQPAASARRIGRWPSGEGQR